MSVPVPLIASFKTVQDIQDEHFDYIVVGGGTAGCLIAARIAREAQPKPRVLLVEAGSDDNDDPDNLIPGLTKSKYANPNGNWSYKTVKQKSLNGRIIPYPRGKGLGGCSANNWLAWVRGPKVDYDDWAEAVNDPWWRWENVLPAMKRLEDFRPDCPPNEEKYAHPSPNVHGHGGPIAVGFGKVWQPLIKPCLIASQEAGHTINPDLNDGDPIGLAIPQMNIGDGIRGTSATAFLDTKSRSRLNNLTIVTRTICARVLFSGKEATGVELLPTSLDDTNRPPIVVYAEIEIILSAGAFASPQILLLSGIGPANDLSALNIPLVHNLPAVGQNLRDHTALGCEFIIDSSIPGHNQLLNSPSALHAAHSEYQSSKTGPLAMYGASAAVIFPRLPHLYTSLDFHALSSPTQTFLTAENRPSTEIWMMGGPIYYTGNDCPPDASVLTLEGLCQNNLSRGSLKLASRNPREFPLIDPAYLSHPYDLRIAIETLREMLQLANTPTMTSIIKAVLHGPRHLNNEQRLADASDEQTLKTFIIGTITQGFHAMGTCIMGRAGEADGVIGPDFKVVGVEGLRVADMSVCPILTSNHTQINAYLIGERCADVVLGKGSG